MRKIIMLIALWCDEQGMSDWRQNTYNLNHVKRLMRTAQNKKRSKAKSPEQVQKNEALIVQAHQNYLSVSQAYLDRARQTLILIETQALADEFNTAEGLAEFKTRSSLQLLSA